MSGSETDKVKRYGLYERDANGDFDAHMEQEENGAWVKFSALSAAQGEITRYREALGRIAAVAKRRAEQTGGKEGDERHEDYERIAHAALTRGAP